VNAKVREIFWINILNRHDGAGSGTPTANALGGAADIDNHHSYRTDCAKC